MTNFSSFMYYLAHHASCSSIRPVLLSSLGISGGRDIWGLPQFPQLSSFPLSSPADPSGALILLRSWRMPLWDDLRHTDITRDQHPFSTTKLTSVLLLIPQGTPWMNPWNPHMKASAALQSAPTRLSRWELLPRAECSTLNTTFSLSKTRVCGV